MKKAEILKNYRVDKLDDNVGEQDWRDISVI